MGPGFIGLLSVKEWLPAHASEATYTATATQETPPAPGNDAQGVRQSHLAYRFARVEAHSADLLIRIVKANGAVPTLGSGDYRILAGTAEILQLADGSTLYVAAPSSSTGAVIWGR